MKILVLGSTGMLGSAVGKFFLERYGEDKVFLSYRNRDVSYGKNTFFFEVSEKDISFLPKCDFIINCIGITNRTIQEDIVKSIHVNAIFPHILAHWCHKTGAQLIHITTDCVFSGSSGGYIESSEHNCSDIYGKTKSLGEPADLCMVLRTSIIGEELHARKHLVEWMKEQRGKDVCGYTNHLWNGITTKQYAEICGRIIDENLYSNGIFHIFSPGIISKYTLLNLLNDRFSLDARVLPTAAESTIDRSLSTTKDLCEKLKIPTIQEQINLM